MVVVSGPASIDSRRGKSAHFPRISSVIVETIVVAIKAALLMSADSLQSPACNAIMHPRCVLFLSRNQPQPEKQHNGPRASEL